MDLRAHTTWACLLAIAACEDGEGRPSDAGWDAGSDAGSDAATDDDVTLVTLNLALAPTVKGPKERLPALREAVAALDADVLCLQEAFSPTIQPSQLASMLEESFPYAHFTDEGPSTSLGNGVLLLSKHPLSNLSAKVFETNELGGLLNRVLLVADVALGERLLHVACTHLSAGLGAEDIARKKAQVEEIFAFLDARAPSAGPTFLLGDFNAGPDPVGACNASSEPACDPPDLETYELVLTRFEDPNADATFCTQCKDIFDPMQILGTFSSEPDQRIDHCFVADLAPFAHAETRIVVDEDPMLEVDGEVLHSLSDHRGVACSFQVDPT
jgi:endonuclease/exonuclease/phosphatase family metal-dependent hydrolase